MKRTMTPERREELTRLMAHKTYLYEVYGIDIHGRRFILTYVNADNDTEARSFALECFHDAKFVRRDHWGKGPFLPILNVC